MFNLEISDRDKRLANLFVFLGTACLFKEEYVKWWVLVQMYQGHSVLKI